MFIVLEGLDRAGKATQLKMITRALLKKRLGITTSVGQFNLLGSSIESAFKELSLSKQLELLEQLLSEGGLEVAAFSFPQYYKSFWGKFIGKGLRGDYGPWDKMNPYIVSVFYALDRATAAPKIKKALKEGKVVISDRYTTSNILFQGAKFKSEQELEEYVNWLEDLEYRILKIPKPDYVLFLDVTPEVSEKLKEKAYKDKKKRYLKGKKDLNEENKELLNNAYDVALWFMRKRPHYFVRIPCLAPDNSLLPPDVIADRIFKFLEQKMF